ncbi:hypothetical protein WN48_06231 [Eufriesea mexicana]|uniref:Protein with SprT-like domain at the N terminus n=1 Tax=Eufriesea mexicana TaxID=516756 RepID=A0A310SAA4_9HYME|nr:hypothetical protein WN48_06231 [Eufriesea mexicana]
MTHKLHQGRIFGLSENAVLPKNKDKENYKPKTLIDQTLELLDPTPNIYTLFVQFNERFFWNVLLPVEVKWSPRMTSCAGICTFHPRNRQCVISLSAPLLKLRPRKDLVETLLHEMIHGYLFLTNNNRDRNGHGPEFCKHMDRINKAAGTKITIYHSFHDEVRLYQQHWWRCDGPCQKRAPYFGTVRRAMNRAPGPTDFWWKEHQQICGGQFIKIKEPENFTAKSSKTKDKIKPKNTNLSSNISNWITKATPFNTELEFTTTPKSIKSTQNNQNSLNELKKLGSTANNIYGWDTGGPNSSNNSKKYNNSSITKISTPSKFSFSGVVGGSNTGQSNLLNKLYINNHSQSWNKNTTSPGRATNSLIDAVKIKKSIVNNSQSLSEVQMKFVKCPICNNSVLNNEINKHIDFCLITRNEKTDECKEQTTIKNYDNDNSMKSEVKTNNFSFTQKRKNDSSIFLSKKPKLDELQNFGKANCPICNNNFNLVDINKHIDKCLFEIGEQNDNLIIKLDDTNVSNNKDTNETFPAGISLNDHLKDCIGSVFNNDLSLPIDNDNNELSSTVSEDEQNNKYPCPVCMQLIIESQMNLHLDACLSNK